MAALVALGVAACERHEEGPKYISIIWDGSNQLESVHWKIDGQDAGKGLDGYMGLIARLQKLDQHADIYIHHPLRLWNETIEGYQDDDVFPFRRRADLRDEFNRLCLVKHFGITCSPYDKEEPH